MKKYTEEEVLKNFKHLGFIIKTKKIIIPDDKLCGNKTLGKIDFLKSIGYKIKKEKFQFNKTNNKNYRIKKIKEVDDPMKKKVKNKDDKTEAK